MVFCCHFHFPFFWLRIGWKILASRSWHFSAHFKPVNGNIGPIVYSFRFLYLIGSSSPMLLVHKAVGIPFKYRCSLFAYTSLMLQLLLNSRYIIHADLLKYFLCVPFKIPSSRKCNFWHLATRLYLASISKK